MKFSCIKFACQVIVLVLALATSAVSPMKASLTNRTKHMEALTVVETRGCRVAVHKTPGTKANFVLEPLLCWRKGMDNLLCPGFDYLQSRHFIRVPVLLADPGVPDEVKLLIERLHPMSVKFMDLANVSFQLVEFNHRVELEEQLITSEGRKYLMIRVYCSGLGHCEDIKQGLISHPSLLFERMQVSVSTGEGVSSLNRSISAGYLQCRSETQSAPEIFKRSRAASPETDAEYSAVNRTRLIEQDGYLYVLVQQRWNGTVSFQRNWADYENGFGSITGDFWIGLRLLHTLTRPSRVLRIELVRFRDSTFKQDFFHAEYNDFKISQAPLYTLSYSAFNKPRSTTLGDALADSRGRGFSTQDRDNDGWSESCSHKRGGGGGWWFNSNCGAANPNGIFYNSNVGNESGIRWAYLDSTASNYKLETLKYFRIMLRI